MDLSKYMKVTAPDGVHPMVLLATTKEFFQARGFKIEEPTEEEVMEFFPETRTERSADRTEPDQVPTRKARRTKGN